MAKFTNKAPGARGINLKSGQTVYVEAGETVDLDDKDVVSVHEDIKKGAAHAARSEEKPAAKTADKKS